MISNNDHRSQNVSRYFPFSAAGELGKPTHIRGGSCSFGPVCMKASF